MIKRIKNSLTIKICTLIAVLLAVSSGITYAVIVGFLPTYYSKQLQKDIDSVSQEMIETIHSYETINEASYAIELFEAGSKVSVVILDEQGNRIWPAESTAVTEDVLDNGVVEQGYMGDMILTHENSAEQTTIVQEENAAYEEGVIGQADVVTEDVVQQADGIAEVGDNSAVKRYSVKVGGETYTMIVSGGMQPVNQALEILYQILPYILGIAIVVSILFALGASLYLTFPIVRLSQLAQNMAALDFDSSYQGKRTDEVGVLGESLNELSKNLSRALEELKSANEKLKSDIEMERKIEKKRIAFFSAVSHELKTPISAIMMSLKLLEDNRIGKLNTEQESLSRNIKENSDRLLEITSELLKMSQVESGKLYLNPKITKPIELIDYAIKANQVQAERFNCQIEVEYPEKIAKLFVDSEKIAWVVTNLLSNAIRYSSENGRIVIGARQIDKAVEIYVKDFGKGIDSRYHESIFDHYFRVPGTKVQGSGLGLAISKDFVEAHGGTIRIESEVGKGSTFVVRFNV